MIFRDDDISRFTDMKRFKTIHQVFQEHEVIHTLAIIAKDIDKATELIQYIQDNKEQFDLQLHCWEHIDYSINESECYPHFRDSRKVFKEVFGEHPSVFYPPWNRGTKLIQTIAQNYRMTLSTEKISLSQYVRFNGSVKEEVVNFHYWADHEVMMLDPALRIYKDRMRQEQKRRCV